MSEGMMPTTTIEGHEIGRLVIGTNWFLGHSHQSAAKSKWIRRYQDAEKIANVLEICTAGFDPDIADYDIANPDHILEMAGLVIEKAFKLPGLDCGACGYESCYGLAREILQGRETPDACPCLRPLISLTIDGKKADLSEGMNIILRKTVQGILSGLKGFKRGTVDIEMP